jgi:hypothetical protein
MPVHASHYPLIAIRHVLFDTAAEPSTEISILLLRDAITFGDRSSGMGLRRNQGVTTAAQGHTYYKCGTHAGEIVPTWHKQMT